MKTKDGVKVVLVSELPYCDACHHAVIERRKNEIDKIIPIPKAQYDCKTKQGFWAYLCETHFKLLGVGLGNGKGQMLVEKKLL